MKGKIVFSILALGTIVLFGATDAQAQTPDVTQINVPFGFTVGDQFMPAGDYLIHRLSPQVPNLIRIMGRDGELEATVHSTTPVRGDHVQMPGKRVFNKYGNDLFLSQLWLTGWTDGREFRVSDAEREVAANLTFAVGPPSRRIFTVSKA